MHAYALGHVADDKLLADLSLLVVKDRQTTAALLAHIAEVDARELFKPAACSTMHGYCVRVLHLSEDAAFKRIRAARAGRRFPQIFAAIADGRLHLSGAVLLAPHLTDGNVDELIAAATHKSKASIEILLAARAPRPDLPTRIMPVDPAPAPAPATGDLLSLAPGPVESTAPAPLVTRTKPLSPERYGLQVTISQATRDKLERAQALLRHSNPSGELADVIDRALDALLDKLEKQKFGATTRPRATRARSEDADPRAVPNAVKRAVHERDGEQCTYVSADGVRCAERGFLELDHIIPVARGGRSTVDNLCLRCRAHNQYLAELALGAAFMRARRRAAAEARAARNSDDAAARITTRVMAGAFDADAHDAAIAAPTARDADTPPDADADARDANHVAAVEPAHADVAAARAAMDDAVLGSFDADVTLALRSLGFKAEQARRAVERTAHLPVTTLEQRLRAALAELTPSRGGRCSEDVAALHGRADWLQRSVSAVVPMN